MNSYFTQLKGIFRKEVQEVTRDKFALFMTFLMPILQIYLFTLAIETNVSNLRTVVLDNDNSAESRALISRIVNTGYFKIVAITSSLDELQAKVVKGGARVGIVIPENYRNKTLSAGTSYVEAIIDGSDATIAAQSRLALAALGEYLNESILNPVPRQKIFEFRTQVKFNPGMDSDTFIVPGLVVILLQKISIMMTAFSIVREKAEGTLDQIRLAVSFPPILILGKIAPYFFMLLGIYVFLFTIMTLNFSIPVSGSLIFLFSSTLLFLLLCLSIGVFISLYASTHAQAMQLSYIIIMPSIILSGFVFPRDLMPLPIQYLSLLLPATHFMEIFRGTVLRGGGFSTLWVYDFWIFTMLTLVLFMIQKLYKKTDN